MRFAIALLCAATVAAGAACTQDGNKPALAATGPTSPVAASPATAPASQSTTMSLAERQELARKYLALQQQMLVLFRDQKWAEAVEKSRAQIALFPQRPEGYYNLACALARMGKAEEAFTQLARALDAGFADPEHMQADDDLETLRADKRFAALVQRAVEVARQAEEKGYERGEAIAGVKMIEGRPEGGLRYRLRIGPTATKAQPHRLIIWLHPSGGSMNAVVEKLAPQFAERGFALLVLTYKNFLGWSDADITKLLDKTLPEVAKAEGLDARRPILLGYSAGGQAALQIYYRTPARWGGLVLDAAYPVARQASQPGLRIHQPPPGDALGRCPVLVVVGTADGGAQIWSRADAQWRKAGVPLTIEYVPGGPHTWLFDGPRTSNLMAWLKKVAAGQMPSQPSTMPATRPAGEILAGLLANDQ